MVLSHLVLSQATKNAVHCMNFVQCAPEMKVTGNVFVSLKYCLESNSILKSCNSPSYHAGCRPSHYLLEWQVSPSSAFNAMAFPAMVCSKPAIGAVGRADWSGYEQGSGQAGVVLRQTLASVLPGRSIAPGPSLTQPHWPGINLSRPIKNQEAIKER